ncbi:misato mitochondrial distribution and morphology regulator [Oratosquilla oratoria]|uniref:misato mitochondrial distribution and morphology regulator n=1 Tax=Oratosquilla oratoria TaxID=337810 RepID=UPI003F777DE2
MTHELITLQVGHYANFVGTHWWNLQEASFVYSPCETTELNHDYLFKDGLTQYRQETYTPRLLCIDAKDCLNTLSKNSILYNPHKPDISTSDALWEGNVELIKQDPAAEKNEYLKDLEEEDFGYYEARDEDKDICTDDSSQSGNPSPCVPASFQKVYDLTKKINVWSDFLRPHLHTKAIYELEGIWHDSIASEGSQVRWGFQAGVEDSKKDDVAEDIADRIRILAEGCGNLQGFQVLADIHNGMGGVTWNTLQHLYDEYEHKTVFTIALSPPHLKITDVQDNSLLLASTLQAYAELSKFSSMFLPLHLRHHPWKTSADPISFPFLDFQLDSAYHSSGILASLLETISTGYRTKRTALPLAHIAGLLTPLGRKVVSSHIAAPLGLGEDQYLFDWLIENKGPRLTPVLGVSADEDMSVVAEFMALRGVSNNQLMRSGSRHLKGLKYSSAVQLYRDYVDEKSTSSIMNIVGGATDLLKTSPPFPHIFTKEVTIGGLIDLEAKEKVPAVRSLPALASLRQTNGILPVLRPLHEDGSRLVVARVPKLLQEGIDSDNWKTTLEDLKELMGCYEDKEISDSDD